MIRVERAIVKIPHGFLSNGSWIRQAQLRQLNGYDEEYLAETRELPIPLRTTGLLKRIVKFENMKESDAPETVRHLTVGDRVALIFHLRKLLFGDKLECLLTCPACKDDMSLSLSISQLLQPMVPHPQSEYVAKAGKFVLRLRPVTGADLEELLGDEQSDKSERLVRSCIVFSKPPLPDKFTDNILAMVSSKLGELDPQADLVLELSCPTCGHSFQNAFDVEKFIFQEIEMRQEQLEQEVHWLAFNYNWSEETILSLPLTKRKRYVELINRTLSGEGI